MAKHSKQRSTAPTTSLFPFAQQIVNHPRVGFVVAAAYGIAMLVVGLTYHVIGDYHVETDFYWSYVQEARAMMSGRLPIEDFRGPAYPMLLGITGTVIGEYFTAGIVLSTLAAALVLFFAYELLRRLFRADTALLATLLVAANTTFVRYTYTAGTDMVFNAFVTASVFFLLKDEQRVWRSIIISAVLAGIAYLTRYNGVALVVAAPAAIVLANPFGLEMRERIKTAAVFVGVFFLVIAPWGFYCLAEKGSFFYNKNYLNIAYEMFAKGRIGWDQFWNVEAHRYESLTHVIFLDFGLFVRQVLFNIVDHARSDMGLLLGWHIGVLSVVGVVAFFKEKPGARLLSLFIIGAGFFAVLLLVFYGERFSMFLLPIYVLLALRALTMPKVSEWRFWNRIHIGALVGYGLLVWTAAESYGFHREHIDSGPTEILHIAEWFNARGNRTESDSVIIARKPHIAYYLDMRLEYFPYVNTLEELHAHAKASGASLLYFSLMEAGLRPQFRILLDPSQAPPWLTPLVSTNVPPSVLYRIEREKPQ